MTDTARRPLYAVPDCIKDQCNQQTYSRWLQRKAEAHVRRDRGRLKTSCTVSTYKRTIHAAVTDGGDRDFYTGELLNWSLISKYQNAASNEGKVKYKKSFALLPTVDHTLDESGRLRFVICSWRMNDMKNDMTSAELYGMCELVLKHRK